MSPTVSLREKRAGIIGEARAKWNTATLRRDGPSAEDRIEFDRAMDAAEKLKDQVDRLELHTPAPEARSRQIPGDAGELVAYRHWLKTGAVRADLQAGRARSAELRDTVLGTDAKGGYLVMPTAVSADLVTLIRDLVFVRRLSPKAYQVTDAKSLGVRKMSVHMADADWTGEVAAVTEDTTMAFDRRDLTPALISKLAKVSMRTLALSADVERIINDELAYKFGVTEEKAFLTGDGSSKPLGIFTASANGISTARDVACASATVVAGDDLINCKFSLKSGHLASPSRAWVVSREFIKRVRKLKVASTTGGNDLEYIWQPGLTDGQPDRILDIPFYMSEYAPATFTTGLYVAVLGNFSYYRIAEVVGTLVQRLDELYTATNEVGFIGRRWVDGAPVLDEAFARLKMA